MRSILPPLAFAALLLLPVAARAGLPGYQVVTKHGPATVYTTPNKATVIYGNTSGITTAQQESLARAYGLAMPGNVAGGVTVADTVKVALGGAVIDAVATRTVPTSALPGVATAAVALYGAGAIGWDIGSAINQWIESAGMRVTPSGGFEYSPPQDLTAPGSGAWGWSGTNPGHGYSSAGAACAAWAGSIGQTMTSVDYLSPTQYQCRATYVGSLGVVSKTIACPFGQPDSEGLCPYTKHWEPIGKDGAEGHLGNKPPARPDLVVQEGVGAGVPVPAGGPQLSGPSSGPGRAPSSSQTTNTGADGQPTGTSSTTVNVTNNYHYDGDTVTVTQTVTNNTTNPDGSTTETQQETEPDLLCGVPGFPPCNVKVDEKGTPEWVQPSNKALDDVKAADAVKLNEVAQTIPEPDLGWFGAPPIAACRKIVYPHGIGEADPCGVVDSVRSVMAYLWAIVAAWMSFGWIRQAVNGG